MDFVLLKEMMLMYLLTIIIELPILSILLSWRHSCKVRLFAGVWLTACTYPIVYLTLPAFLNVYEPHRSLYLWVAETFAPAAECTLFWLAFIRNKPRSRRATCWDFAVIILANLASFHVGEKLLGRIG